MKNMFLKFDLEDYATRGPGNIVSQFDSCLECNGVCFKLTDCETLEVSATTQDLSAYNGKIIRWHLTGNDTVIHCAIVTAYKCRNEEHPMVEIEIVDCFTNCEDCLPQPPAPEPDFSIRHRKITPGINVPDCSTSNPNTDTSSDCDCTRRCNL